MTTRTCDACNTVPTTERHLMLCGACKNASYCNRACQKAHWKAHKPMCLTISKQNTKINNHEDETTVDGFKDEHGNVVVAGKIHPPGTYIDYLMPPSPGYPRGRHDTIILEPKMVIWFANLSEGEKDNFERKMVDGLKSGALTKDVFDQIARKRDVEGAGKVDETVDPTEYEKALQTLASRYRAARVEDDNSDRSRFGLIAGTNERGDLIMRDAEGEEYIHPADSYRVVEIEGEREMVRFGAEIIANMKYMSDGEKKVYKQVIAREAIEERYAGKTRAEVIAQQKQN